MKYAVTQARRAVKGIARHWNVFVEAPPPFDPNYINGSPTAGEVLDTESSLASGMTKKVKEM